MNCKKYFVITLIMVSSVLLRFYDVRMNTAKNIPAEVTWMSDETESTF